MNFSYHDPFDDRIPTTSVLYEASHRGQVSWRPSLLIGRANPNWQKDNDGYSSLHAAAEEGFNGIVSTLLLRGADRNALDHFRGDSADSGILGRSPVCGEDAFGRRC